MKQKTKRQLWSIVVNANMDNDGLSCIMTIRDIASDLIELVSDGWCIHSVVIERKENFYRLCYIAPSYLDPIVIADITQDDLYLYLERNLSKLKRCMVSDDMLSRITNNPNRDILDNLD